MQNGITLPSMESIREELSPILSKIDELSSIVSKTETNKEYYRNKDLKKKFGFSDGTIINYREQNIIPWTKIGDIHYYPVEELNRMLFDNSNYNCMKYGKLRKTV